MKKVVKEMPCRAYVLVDDIKEDNIIGMHVDDNKTRYIIINAGYNTVKYLSIPVITNDNSLSMSSGGSSKKGLILSSMSTSATVSFHKFKSASDSLKWLAGDDTVEKTLILKEAPKGPDCFILADDVTDDMIVGWFSSNECSPLFFMCDSRGDARVTFLSGEDLNYGCSIDPTLYSAKSVFCKNSKSVFFTFDSPKEMYTTFGKFHEGTFDPFTYGEKV